MDAEQQAFSNTYLKLFIQFIAERGISEKALLENTGIAPDQIDEHSYITLEQFSQLMTNARSLIDDPNWGLAFGKCLQVSAHGLLGNVSLSSSNSLEGLQACNRFMKIQCQLVSIDYQLIEDSVRIAFDTPFAEHDAYRFVIDSSLSGSCSLLGSKMGVRRVASRVQFTYPKPEDITAYRELFGVDVEFDCDKNALEIPLALLLQENLTANPAVFHLATQQCEVALAQIEHNSNLATTIYEILVQTPDYFPSQDKMAERLAITPRTLRRQLQKLDTTYQDILDDVRKEFAFSYLKNTTWSIENISNRLGYSEEMNFSRAFKRWTGLSPSAYRKEQSQEQSQEQSKEQSADNIIGQ